MKLIQAWVETPGAAAAGWTLLHSLWQGAAVAVILAATLALVRSARARYGAACIALLALVVCAGVTFQRSLPPAAVRFALGNHSGRLPEIPAADYDAGSSLVVRSGLLYLPWLTPLWAAGVLAFQLRSLAGWVGARRLRATGVCAVPAVWRSRLYELSGRIGVSRPVVLLESCFADVPVVLGYVRPMILIPVGVLAGLPADQVEAILLHELAHIRRHDYLTNLLQMFVEGVFFYHPAVWWISSVVRAERENCCDDIVVGIQEDAYGYASALTALEARRVVADQTALAATGGNLVKRVRRLLTPPEGPRSGLAPVFSALIFSITLAGVMAAWQTKPTATVPAPLTQSPAKPAPAPAPVGIAQAPLPPPMPGPAPQEVQGELSLSPYTKWLKEDVAYIITDEERAAFKHLPTDAEREHFIDQFWERRDPIPGTVVNEFKAEYYRRIAYANEHFASPGLAGWKTDRGRIYITYGPPDQKETHPSGGTYTRPANQGGGVTTTYPFEQWLYHWIEGIGTDIIVEFVDSTGTGDYRMTMDPSEKDALLLMKPRVVGQTQVRKAGATVRAAGNGAVIVNVPIDPSASGIASIDLRVITSDRGRIVTTSSDVPIRGQAGFAKLIPLAPGTYRIQVSVHGTSGETLAADDLTFDVR